MSYAKKQKKWIKKHDVRVGDFIKLKNKLHDMDSNCYSDNKIHIIIEIGKFGHGIKLDKNDWMRCYHYKSLKKITDLKELAPFYIEVENEEQSRKVQEICFSHGIIWCDGTMDITDYKEFYIDSENTISSNKYRYDPKYNNYRKLTYEQILRFEKKEVNVKCENISGLEFGVYDQIEYMKRNDQADYIVTETDLSKHDIYVTTTKGKSYTITLPVPLNKDTVKNIIDKEIKKLKKRLYKQLEIKNDKDE